MLLEGRRGRASVHGNWKLRCWNEWGKVAIGTGWDTENAFANDYVGEYLDFSSGVATNAASGEQMRIMGHRTKALGVTVNGGPRVIVFSPESEEVGDSNQFMKEWQTVEEVVIDAARLTRIDSWAGFPSAMRRAVLRTPGLVTLADQALRGYPAWPCGATDVADWDLSALKTLGAANFYHTDIRGVLNLPVVETLGGSAMEECHYLTEVRLGAETKSVQSIGNKVLYVTDQGGDRAVGRLKRLVIGGADGFTVGQDAFGGQPLEEVVFTGGVPAFADEFRFTDTAARTVFFAVPRDDAAWAAVLAGKVPTFPVLGGDAHCMNGFHVVSLFLDAWRKGIRGFDLAAAYAACERTLREASYIPWKRCPKTDLDSR